MHFGIIVQVKAIPNTEIDRHAFANESGSRKSSFCFTHRRAFILGSLSFFTFDFCGKSYARIPTNTFPSFGKEAQNLDPAIEIGVRKKENTTPPLSDVRSMVAEIEGLNLQAERALENNNFQKVCIHDAFQTASFRFRL